MSRSSTAMNRQVMLALASVTLASVTLFFATRPSLASAQGASTVVGVDDAPAPLAWDPAHTPLEASATLASDGSFTLLLRPDQAWSQAELTVGGDGFHDLGPADGTAPIEVAGVVDELGPLRVELAAVTPQQHGVSWSFQVQPELLPVAAPPVELTDLGRRRRARRLRKGKR